VKIETTNKAVSITIIATGSELTDLTNAVLEAINADGEHDFLTTGESARLEELADALQVASE
jgi:hypothetical protein